MTDLIGASDLHSAVLCVVSLLCGTNGAAITPNRLDFSRPDADREYDDCPDDDLEDRAAKSSTHDRPALNCR
jgi:hypothetical protein